LERKCKTCGGTVIVPPGATYAECDSCGNRFSLNLSPQEKEDIRRAAFSEKTELRNIEDNIEILQKKISEIGKITARDIFNIIQPILSAVCLILFAIDVSMYDENAPADADDPLMLPLIFGYLASVILIAMCSGFMRNMKVKIPMIVRLIIIVPAQLFTGCAFGIVIGIKDIATLIKTKKEEKDNEARLNRLLKDLQSQREIVKNNIKY